MLSKKRYKKNNDIMIRADVISKFDNSKIDGIYSSSIKDVKKLYKRLIKRL